jgi:hypothetical protein
MHYSCWPPEADCIRWAGVAIAFAGTLIATLDGTLAACDAPRPRYRTVA